jgi:hypothetical protein
MLSNEKLVIYRRKEGDRLNLGFTKINLSLSSLSPFFHSLPELLGRGIKDRREAGY